VSKNIAKQGKLPDKQNNNDEQLLHEMKVHSQILTEQTEMAKTEAYKATLPQRTAQFMKTYKEADNYAKKNNMVRIFVCLPDDEIILPFSHGFFWGKKRDIESFPKKIIFPESFDIYPFTLPYKKSDKFIDASEYGINFCINIPKHKIKKICESDKMQKYFSDNKMNDMFAIDYQGGYIVISPKCFKGIEYEGNPDKEIEVDKTFYIVWLDREELPDFLLHYNNYIKMQKVFLFRSVKKEYRSYIYKDIKSNFVKNELPKLIIGFIILLLLIVFNSLFRK